MEEKYEDKDLEKDLNIEEEQSIDKKENDAEFIPEKEDYEAELINIIRSDEPALVKKEKFNDYHENDIASVLEQLDRDERIRVYSLLGLEKVSEVFAYLDEPEEFNNLQFDKIEEETEEEKLPTEESEENTNDQEENLNNSDEKNEEFPLEEEIHLE